MSVEYCHECGKHIDTDHDVEHFEEHEDMTNTKSTDIVKVEYIDSGIIDEQTDQIADTHRMIAVGFLVREDERHITIAREYDCIENNWRGQIAIPKIVIRYRKDYG